jgi:hypothetical protein
VRAEQRSALVEILTLERELEDLAANAIRAWLGTATQAALPVLTAASVGDIPPDPDAVTRTAAAWESELDNGFLPRFGAIVDRLLGDDRDRLGEWRNRMVGAMRERMSGIPARARKRVDAAIRKTAGQPLDAVRQAAARALSYADSWRGDATEIGRTAVGVFNAARIARAELETAGTGHALDKMWLALHDGHTRHTHQLADRQRVPLGTDFVVGSATLPYPGWIGGPPEEVAGCRCVVAIVESALENPAPARVASAADTGGTTMARSFEALLVPTGVIGRSGQFMMSRTVELVDTVLPMPLKWQRADLPAHEGGLTIGAVQALDLREDGLWGTGTLLDGPDADEALMQVEAGVTRPSAELWVKSEVLADAAGNTVSLDAAEQLYASGAPVVMRWDTVEVAAATLVSVPEFRDTVITIGDSVNTPPPLALVAAAAKARIVEPDIYPAAFFEDPGLTDPTPIHVTAEGRVLGHLACWKAHHTAYPDMEVTPYHSNTGYAAFHQSPIHLDSGGIMGVGRLTVGGGHAVAGKGMRAALEHYDDVTTCWAYVLAGEDDIGIWVSGCIAATADEKMVKLALQTPHSGHWERVGGAPELLIGHAVNSPGFLNPAVQRVRDRDGDLALVASFAPRQSKPATDTSVLDDVARRAVAAYAEQQAATARQDTARQLIAASAPRRRLLADAIRESHARHARKAS